MPVAPGELNPFGGDLDTGRLRDLLRASADRVKCVVLTITNNAGGGQPVSVRNVKEVRQFCDAHGVPLYLDASRFAENAYLVTEREDGYGHLSPREVARVVFELADGCWASLKKDGMANIGGLIAFEGFPTYGGLVGRDLEVLAEGLLEVVEPDYLRYRAECARWFGEQLSLAGPPVLQPTGCHAVYVDAGRCCCTSRRSSCPPPPSPTRSAWRAGCG